MSEVNAHDRVASEVFVTDADYKILERLLDAPNARSPSSVGSASMPLPSRALPGEEMKS